MAKAGVVFDNIIGFLVGFVSVLLVLVVFVISLEVILRNLVGRPQTWVIEVAEFSLLFITFLGAAWVLKMDRHVKLDVVLNRLSPKGQGLANIITSMLSAIVCLVITWYSALATWDLFQSGVHAMTPLEPPKAPFMAVVTIGSFLLFIQFLRRTHGYLRKWGVPQQKAHGLRET